MKKKKHRHRWVMDGYITSGTEVSFRCRCGERKSRKTTSAEKKLLRADWKKTCKHAGDLHKIWHKVADLIVYKFEDKADKKRITRQTQFKMLGYDLMCKLDKLEKKYPSIRITGCDDSSFMGSSIAFVPHEADGDYMGVTMLVIPQNGEEPVEVFLYPNHVHYLIETLKEFKRRKSTYNEEEEMPKLKWKPR